MRRAIALALIMVIIVLVAYFTKPTRQQCMDEAVAQYEKVLDNMVENAPATVSKELFRTTLLKAFEQGLSVKDNMVYQQIYQQKGGVNNTIGWGAFGLVQIHFK